MARTVAQIQQQIINQLIASAAAVGITIDPAQWSAYDYKQLLTYCVSVGDATLEQLFDAFIAESEAIIATGAPQTPAWFQAQMFKFQYSSSDPQVIQFNTTTFAPFYPNVNLAYQIIKYCSVVAGATGSLLIKCAEDASGSPSPLNSSKKSAALSYIQQLAAPGISYVIRSDASDKIMVGATIYYQGQYDAIIRDNVKAAINGYLASIPFDGVVTLSRMFDAVQSVAGVNDMVFNNVIARMDATSYGGGTVMIAGSTELQRNYSTFAGYIVSETTTGHTLTDTLTFVAQ